MQILIIQTAFIGDVVLATPIIEGLKAQFRDSKIDFLLRKGNESLFDGHPHLREVLAWDKQQQKLKNLWRIVRKVRSAKYDLVINVHRYLSSGMVTVLSGAGHTVGFKSNPCSLFFGQTVAHVMDGRHEVARNLSLIADWVSGEMIRPKLYIDHVRSAIAPFQSQPYITISPGSVWATKQLPKEKWVDFLNHQKHGVVYLLGGPGDVPLCEAIKSQTESENVTVLAGKLSMLESCALMAGAVMNYVNDSAPMHFASAVNAPVTAVYCSTIPRFGFRPLADNSFILQSSEILSCRPCGLHGRAHCPEGHFRCGHTVILVD